MPRSHRHRTIRTIPTAPDYSHRAWWRRCAGRRIAIFFSGRQHAGENLSDVLQHRAAELDAPIHMCDGLSRNLPKELATILANCLSHGRRKFADLVDRFTDQCRYVIDALKVVYHNDQVAREKGMSAEERLAYHQAHSQSTMDDLKAWLQRQFDEKLVEPNSALGDAISYLLKRWDALTLFLRKAGAPLDNNICERALKRRFCIAKTPCSTRLAAVLASVTST